MNKEMRKKNQIFKYYALSPKKLIKIISERLIDEKPLNPVGNEGRKPKDL